MITESICHLIAQTYMQEEFHHNPACYFYDLEKIRDNVQKLQSTMPEQVHLYYAMKANSNEAVMDCIREEAYVRGLEIASSGELEFALRWYQNKDIIFTGPGKTEYELECAIRAGIRFINIESVTEAVRIDRIAERLGVDTVEILVRINLNYCCMDGAESMSAICGHQRPLVRW